MAAHRATLRPLPGTSSYYDPETISRSIALSRDLARALAHALMASTLAGTGPTVTRTARDAARVLPAGVLPFHPPDLQAIGPPRGSYA